MKTCLVDPQHGWQKFQHLHYRSLGYRMIAGDLTLACLLRSDAHASAECPSLNRIAEIIIGCAIRVHRALGPGLLESVYLACLAFELHAAGLNVETQRAVPVEYRGIRLECGFRADLVVEGQVVVEIKSIERLAPVHEAQMITYLRLTGCALGLILNFNTKLMKDGVKRIVNNFPEP